MRRKLIPIFCILAMTVAAASAQTAQAPPKTAPPPVPLGPTRNAAPSPEVQRLGAQIAAYATAQCSGKDAATAPDCRVKALWAATQCPEKMTATPSEMKTGSGNCALHESGFEYEVSSIKPRKDNADSSSHFGPTSDGYRATNTVMINIVMKDRKSTRPELQSLRHL